MLAWRCLGHNSPIAAAVAGNLVPPEKGTTPARSPAGSPAAWIPSCSAVPPSEAEDAPGVRRVRRRVDREAGGSA